MEIKMTTREAIINFLSNEWKVAKNNKDITSIEDLKGAIENVVL